MMGRSCGHVVANRHIVAAIDINGLRGCAERLLRLWRNDCLPAVFVGWHYRLVICTQRPNVEPYGISADVVLVTRRLGGTIGWCR